MDIDAYVKRLNIISKSLYSDTTLNPELSQLIQAGLVIIMKEILEDSTTKLLSGLNLGVGVLSFDNLIIQIDSRKGPL